jgi:hypothetical protein
MGMSSSRPLTRLLDDRECAAGSCVVLETVRFLLLPGWGVLGRGGRSPGRIRETRLGAWGVHSFEARTTQIASPTKKFASPA